MTKKDQKESSFLSWLVVGQPNFRGGHQWLNKYQYSVYKLAMREVNTGMVTENQENLIMTMFHQQREVLEKNKNQRLSEEDQHQEHPEGTFLSLSLL